MQTGKNHRWRRIAIGAALYFSAVALGLGSAFWVLKIVPLMNPSVHIGAWKAYLRSGSPDADMYTRAIAAVNGLLALGRDETMYFIADADDAGHPLHANCNYRIEGNPPKSRWWSVTAYADNLFLFEAANQHYSLNATTASLDEHGRFSLATGPQEPAGTYWLPTSGHRGMVLTLRLYNPDPELQAAPSSLSPPSIQMVGGCT